MIHLIFFSIFYIRGLEKAELSGVYTLKVVVRGDLDYMIIHLPLPVDYHGCTSYQKVLSIDYSIQPSPKGKKILTKKTGSFLKVRYGRISNTICTIKVNFSVERGINLENLPDDRPGKPIMEKTKSIRPDYKEIISLAERLAMGHYTIKDISNQIVYYIGNNIDYYIYGNEDAVNTLKDGSGNCMGISALAVSLFRASGVESRLVTGISLEDDKKYTFRKDNLIYSVRFSSFEDLHQWCEIRFPTCGWAELEPQGHSCFVPVGYIRLATGEEGVDYPYLIVYSYRGRPSVKYSVSVEGNIRRLVSHFKSERVERRGYKPIIMAE